MFRNHLKHDELRYPNSAEIQSEDVQSQEVITPFHERSSRKRLSLVQVINTVFILVASLTIIGPPILDKVFNIHIGVSQYNHLDAGIHQGDLLVIKDVRISEITSGDVVIFHDIVGETPDQQHLGSAIAVANSKKLNVSVLRDSSQVSATESVTVSSKMQVVVRYFPKVGNIVNFLVCNFVKLGFVFVVGIYNLLSVVSRLRRDANSRGLFGSQSFGSIQEPISDQISPKARELLQVLHCQVLLPAMPSSRIGNQMTRGDAAGLE